jgi:HPt (histidine-containing phosphotransfer) domain-containing protein
MHMSLPVDGGPAGQGVLDVCHLARQTMGDAGLERELLQLFAQHSPALMARIEAAGTPDGRSVAAHTLKGSARAIGAWAVADAAAAIEAGGDALQQLRAALDRTGAAIAARLAAQPS